jgi:hypothetical protein
LTSTSGVDGATEVAGLTDEVVEKRYFDWSEWAYEQQREPEGDWTTWLFMGGRGCGKTRTGAEWVRGLAAKGISPIALVGETMSEALAIMVRGESGLFHVCRDEERPRLRGQQLIWSNGVEATLMSASDPERFRGPQFAAAWCDELGCGAVDKGANQPNVFGDPKSAESGWPYFSTGLPDPLIQRQVLRAHQAWWRDPANNPAGMVDVDRLYLWTWDARPYPAFPGLTDVWADGPNHRNGHWLTGRLGGMASDELAAAIAADHGVALSADPAAPLVGGMVLGTTTTGREALEPLMSASGLSLRNRAGGLHLGLARRGEAVVIDEDGLVAGEGATLSRRRGDPAEAPGRLALTYLDRERNYLTGTVTALSRTEGPLAGETSAMTLDASGARLAAERMLDARNGQRETLDFGLPPSALTLEPGDLVDIAGLSGGPFEIAEIRDGLMRRVTARTLASDTAVATGIDRPLAVSAGPAVRALPHVVVAHLPPLPADTARSRLAVAAYAQPWPGSVQLVDDMTGTMAMNLPRRGLLGTLATALQLGPMGVWDNGNAVEVTLLAGHLSSAEPLAVLSGNNRLAVETDAGGWEVIGFAQADLVAPGRYRLTRLLRGLEGTEMGTAAAGKAVMVLDARVVTLPVEQSWLGEARDFRVYAGASDIDGVPLAVAMDPGPALPLAPVHLRAIKGGGGDIALQWVQRSRADGDGWGTAESPLEHVPERYRLTIMDGISVMRTVEVGGAATVYASSDQLADFGAPPSSFVFTVAQISPVLGAGHAAQGEFHG